VVTVNFKRRGRMVCAHGHLHPDPTAARLCNAAHRMAAARRLNAAELVDALRAVLARAHERNARRGQ
jgi:hypothetical protein